MTVIVSIRLARSVIRLIKVNQSLTLVIVPLYKTDKRHHMNYLNYVGHHVYPWLFILSPHRGPDLRWKQTPRDAQLPLKLGNMRFRPGTRHLIPLNIQGIVAFSVINNIVFFVYKILACLFISVSLKYKPELFLFSSSDYKSFICVSSVWSTWEAKTSSRDTQRNVAGSTRQPMRSTGKMTFLYLRLAPLFRNKAIAVYCMWLQWMDSGVVVEGKMGAGWEKKSLFFFLHSMFRLMEMSANSSAKTSACWPSFSWITRPCIMMWSLSSSTFLQRMMRKAVILWVISPR